MFFIECSISSGSALFAKKKMIFRERYTIFFGNYNRQPLNIYNGNPDFNSLNFMEKAIGLQRVISKRKIFLLKGELSYMRNLTFV